MAPGRSLGTRLGSPSFRAIIPRMTFDPCRARLAAPRHGYCMGVALPTMYHDHIPTKLKYLSVTVMTAASTMLGKSVRFLKHVSPGCCACIASTWSA